MKLFLSIIGKIICENHTNEIIFICLLSRGVLSQSSSTFYNFETNMTLIYFEKHFENLKHVYFTL